MKKLLLSLLLVCLLIPMLHAGDGKAILEAFSFNNWWAVSYGDHSNFRSAKNEGSQSQIAEGRGNKGWFYFIDSFSANFSQQVFESDLLKIGVSNSNNLEFVIEKPIDNNAYTNYFVFTPTSTFSTSFTIADMYTTSVGATAQTTWLTNVNEVDTDQTDDAGNPSNDYSTAVLRTRFKFTWNNSINVKDLLSININIKDTISWRNDWDNKTNNNLWLTLGLSGSYDFGFSWHLWNEYVLGIDLENLGGHGPLITNRSDYGNWEPVPRTRITMGVSQDIMKLAGVDNVSLSVSLGQTLWIRRPFYVTSNDIYTQYSKLETQGQYGLNLGVKGFGFGAYLVLDTVDGWADFDETVMPENTSRGHIGFMGTIGYNNEFFGFGLTYTGLGDMRDYDKEGDNFESYVDNGGPADGSVVWDCAWYFNPYNGWAQWNNQLDVSFTFRW